MGRATNYGAKLTDEKQNSPEQKGDGPKLRMTRRKFLWIGGLGTAGALTIGRFGCYSLERWDGVVLAKWEAHTVAAAAEALIPDEPSQWPASGPSPMEVAQNVDQFLQGMPRPMLREVRGLFGLIEHGTLLGGRLSRFTRLSPDKRLDILVGLGDRGGLFAQVFDGIRSLCFVGWYQDPRTWEAIGYDGPLFDRPPPPPVLHPDQAMPYEELVAEPGSVPRGVL